MSIVIFFGIVVMWAVVLIPMWVRRHDEVEETRSVDKFTSAMHTLSRREAAVDNKYVVMPHRSSSHDVHVSGASADGRRTRKRRPAARTNKKVMTAAARRRRTLLGLLAATVITVALAVMVGGLALWGLQAIVDACLVAFVAHLRGRARQAAQVRPARRRPTPAPRPAPRYEPEYDDELDDTERFEPVPVRVAAPAPAAVATAEAIFDQTAVVDDDEVEYPDVAVGEAVFDGRAFDDTAFDTEAIDADEDITVVVRRPVEFEPSPVAAQVVFDQTADFEDERALPAVSYEQAVRDLEIDIPLSDPVAEPAASAIGSRPWEPIPVPRPMYTTKPTAPPRTPRAPILEPLLPPIETAAELDPVDDLEEILDRRWAVND